MLKRLMRKWRGTRWRVEDFDEERAFHLEMATQQNLAAGMGAREARQKAIREFGNNTRLREAYRDERGWRWCEDFFADLKYGMRVLLRRKGTALASIVMLALSLGASATFFAAMNSLVFSDLPFDSPSELYEVARYEQGRSIGSNLSLYNEYVSREDLFDEVSYFQGKWANIDARGVVFRGQALKVTAGFFDLLGRQPVLGAQEVNSSEGSAWMAESTWKTVYGADPSLVGSTVVVDGRSYTIVGIAPMAAEKVVDEVTLFLGFDRQDLVVDPADASLRDGNEGTIWARLKSGVGPERVREELEQAESLFAEGASQTYRDTNDIKVRRLVVQSVHEVRTEWARGRLMLLNAGAIVVLLIGTINVANLLFAQTNGRAGEFWMRRMLGADTFRLVRQCLGEVLMLVSVAWGLGMMIAMYGVAFLESYSWELFRSEGGIRLDAAVWVYSFLLMSLAALGLGMIVGAKAVSLSRTYSSAKSGIQSTPSKDSVGLRSILAVGQVAFTLLLVVSGGLLMKSFLNVTRQDFGFDEESIVTARIHLSDTKYRSDVVREAFKNRLLEGLRHHPDIQGAALSTTVPTFGYPDRMVLKRDAATGERMQRSYVTSVSTAYFETMGIALLRGRTFSDDDEFGWQTPVVVDRRFAEMMYPGVEVIGKRIAIGNRPRNENNWPVIVGVVQTTRNDRLDIDNGPPMLYLPLKSAWPIEFSVFVKSRRESVSVLDMIRQEVASIDPTLPLYRTGSLASVMNESLKGRKGLLVLCLGMASVALVLSALGMYGASAYRVTERLREFAIRIAVGANNASVIKSHVCWDIRLSLVGCVIGLFLSWQVGRLMWLWLYRVEPVDGTLYSLAVAGLLVVYSLSSYIPSRRGVSRLSLRL